MTVKIKVDKTINNANYNAVYVDLILTFNDNRHNPREFQLIANSFAIRLNGSNDIQDVEFLVEQLSKNGLQAKICMFAKEVMSAQKLIDNNKLLIGKKPASKKKSAKLKVV
mgnify:CR=1 FL=1